MFSILWPKVAHYGPYYDQRQPSMFSILRPKEAQYVLCNTTKESPVCKCRNVVNEPHGAAVSFYSYLYSFSTASGTRFFEIVFILKRVGSPKKRFKFTGQSADKKAEFAVLKLRTRWIPGQYV